MSAMDPDTKIPYWFLWYSLFILVTFLSWLLKMFIEKKWFTLNVYTGKEKRGTTFTIPMNENILRDFVGYTAKTALAVEKLAAAVEKQVSFTTKAVENTALAVEETARTSRSMEKVAAKIEQIQKDTKSES